METSVQSLEKAATAGLEPAGGACYVARQPILDLRNRVHAYELLFSGKPQAAFRGDGEADDRDMIDNVAILGPGELTSGLPAFVPCAAETLTSTLVEMLPAGMTVLEIQAGAESLPTLIGACRNLKAAGYRLALDHFDWEPGIERLIEAAAYIKIDFSATNPEQRRRLLSRLRSVSVALVAGKVETPEQFGQARDEGFALVQGFYFCRPTLMQNHKVPANRISQVEILRLLQEESMNLHKLTQLVKRDVSLTYRLLRLINSPVCAMQQEVHSVQAALLAVGEEAFRRMATVAIASELNTGQPSELLRMAFVRGRFCEVAARFCGLDCTEQYLLGLLSLLPAMLRVPMSELAPSLPLRAEVCNALLGMHVEERVLLEWLERYEMGDWTACDGIAASRKMETGSLARCFQEAVSWAEAALYFA